MYIQCSSMPVQEQSNQRHNLFSRHVFLDVQLLQVEKFLDVCQLQARNCHKHPLSKFLAMLHVHV